MIKIGIVGCGAIGSEIALACQTALKDKFDLRCIYDKDPGKSKTLLAALPKKCRVTSSADKIFEKADLVIEAASGKAASEILKKAIRKSKSVLIMSVGGLINSGNLLKEAAKKGIGVYFPSGAICGIDGLKAAKESKIKSVTLTTRKPPKGLRGAPYLKENKIDIESLKGETVIFEGKAADAVRAFPKNINVSSTLSLVGLGAKKTLVRIISSPNYSKNVHEIEITGDFGRITTKTENVPSEKNPKTSKLAILSALATLRGIAESVKIGT